MRSAAGLDSRAATTETLEEAIRTKIAFLTDYQDAAYARAYGHAARYWARLGEIAGSGVGLLPLPSHEDFEAEIRARHGRKSAFWAYVNGTRRDRHDDEDDLTP